MIISDPQANDIDPSYLLKKFNELMPSDGEVEIVTMDAYDMVAQAVYEDCEGDEDVRINGVSTDFKCFKEYAETCDVLLVMTSKLRDGLTEALINAFNHYNSPNNVYTF